MAKGLPCEPGRRARDEYRAWLFEQQDGVCYLGTHPLCRKIECKMTLDIRNSKGAFATFEHVVARARSPGTTLILLACWRCNNQKASGPATVAQIDRARMLRRRWFNRNLWPPPVRSGPNTQLELEEFQRAHRAAIGMAPGRRTSKYLSNLRKATDTALGR